MSFKKWLWASLVVWVLCFILDWIINGWILMGYYESTAQYWLGESEMMGRLWAMILGQLLFALLFCAIYTKGIREGGLGEGIRYGLWIGLFYCLPIFWQSLLSFIEIIIVGGVLGIIYGKVAKT
jgi:hypothetical protein